MLHPRLREPADRDDPVAMIEATNRSYLLAYRRNARLMALMEQVAQVDEDFRRTRLRRVRAFTDRNAQAIAELQRRGLADPSLDPQLTAEALSAMVGRVAYYRYVHRFNSASIESLTQTLTALWAGALGLNARPAVKHSPAQAKEIDRDELRALRPLPAAPRATARVHGRARLSGRVRLRGAAARRPATRTSIRR